MRIQLTSIDQTWLTGPQLQIRPGFYLCSQKGHSKSPLGTNTRSSSGDQSLTTFVAQIFPQGCEICAGQPHLPVPAPSLSFDRDLMEEVTPGVPKEPDLPSTGDGGSV